MLTQKYHILTMSHSEVMISPFIHKKELYEIYITSLWIHPGYPVTLGRYYSYSSSLVANSAITTSSFAFSHLSHRLTDTDSNEERTVELFHYTTWPDFGVPQSPTALLRFMRAVRKSGALDESAGPPIVHCSAGIGRSGTFILVDCCLKLVSVVNTQKSCW